MTDENVDNLDGNSFNLDELPSFEEDVPSNETLAFFTNNYSESLKTTEGIYNAARIYTILSSLTQPFIEDFRRRLLDLVVPLNINITPEFEQEILNCKLHALAIYAQQAGELLELQQTNLKLDQMITEVTALGVERFREKYRINVV